jgi:hypothetical protein
MGWTLIPTTWFTNEYNILTTHTCTLVDNFNIEQHITDSKKLLYKLIITFQRSHYNRQT